MNTEERQLADVLHRLTPEPPRRVTVEQVAYRLVSEPSGPRLGRQARGREPRPRRGLTLSRAWAPAAAAAAVLVIAGASAGIAVLASSHRTPPSSAGAAPGSSAVSSASVSPSQTSSPAGPGTPTRIAGGPWGAELINRQTFDQVGPVSADGSLYAYSSGYLDRIDPATGDIAATARYNPPLPNPPVIVGNTVWVVWSISGNVIVLHGYDARTLALTSTIQVPATGPVSGAASNVLASGPDGHLYVAAGLAVVVVDPATGQLIRRIYQPPGPAASVAVSPDGSTLYVGVAASSSSFKLIVWDLSSGTIVTESTLRRTDSGGDLVATAGGVWGTTGSGMSEWVWFAPRGELNMAVRVGQGAGGGLASLPSYSGGVMWIGGSHTLSCADPATGRVMDTAVLPTDHSVVEYFGSPAVAAGQAYSVYSDYASQVSGLVRMTPPAACSGPSS